MEKLNLPLTEDGLGYEKEAVERHVEEVSNKSVFMLQQAQALLDDATSQKEEIIQEGHKAVEDLLNEVADRDKKSQEILDTAEDKAAKIIANAQDRAKNITSELERKRAEQQRELDAERKDDEAARKRLFLDAKQKANDHIEENRSRVHRIVKNAEQKRIQSEEKAKKLIGEATVKYSESVAKAGKLIAEANEKAEDIRIDGETMLAYYTEEAKNIREEGQREAAHMIEQATQYRNEVMQWAEAEIEKVNKTLDSYKAFYDDNVSRLSALYRTNLDVVDQLSKVSFPHRSNEQAQSEFNDDQKSHSSLMEEAEQAMREEDNQPEFSEVEDLSEKNSNISIELEEDKDTEVLLTEDELKEFEDSNDLALISDELGKIEGDDEVKNFILLDEDEEGEGK